MTATLHHLFPHVAQAIAPTEPPKRWTRHLRSLDAAVQDATVTIEQLMSEGMDLDIILIGFAAAMDQACLNQYGTMVKDPALIQRLEATLDELCGPARKQHQTVEGGA